MSLTVIDGTELEGVTAGYFVYDGVTKKVYLANAAGALPVGPSSFSLGAHADDAAAEAFAESFPDLLVDGISYVNTTSDKVRYRVAGAWKDSDADALAAAAQAEDVADGVAATVASLEGVLESVPASAGEKYVLTDGDGLIALEQQADNSIAIADLRRADGTTSAWDQIDEALAGLDAAVTLSATTTALRRAVRENACYPRALSVCPAADLVTFALGAEDAASTINGNGTGAANVPLTDAKIQWLAGAGRQDVNNRWTARGGAGGGGGRYVFYTAFEFQFSGSEFELSFSGSFYSAADNVRVMVDDVEAGIATVPWNVGHFWYLKCTFPGARSRRIRIEGSGGWWKGVNVADPGQVSATGRTYPVATILGDSFVEGSGTSRKFDGEGVVLLRALGLNVGHAAVGGTGLLNSGGSNLAWHDVERRRDLTLDGVTDEIRDVAIAPDLGVVCMSVNDQGLSSTWWGPYGTDLQSGIYNRLCFVIDDWLVKRTGKPLVLFGPTWPSGPPNNRPVLDIYRIRDATQQAAANAARHNVWFIDRMMPHYREGIYSTANDQASLYTGGESGTDATHPTPAGHKFDGLTQAAALRRLILSEFA